MQSKPLVYLALAATVGLTSCSKMGPLSSENFAVAPSPLETVDNQVPVVISGRFPEKYMKKNAVVKITPVLRFQGGKYLIFWMTFIKKEKLFFMSATKAKPFFGLKK